MSADIGLIGLAVMGENLVLNMENHGFCVAVFNRTVSKVDDFIKGRGKGKKLIGCHSVEELCLNLKKPRKVMIMVRAGDPVDQTINQIVPHLEKGDIIIDGGNSHFPDTTRRMKALESKGLLFIGTGVSGGEEGALNGPSMMPGGSSAAWPEVKNIFQSICAKVEDGSPCCDWVGEQGAGHFVKMVHNGIEYGDMQLICEAYHLMKTLGMNNQEMHQAFKEWNDGDLDSYLIQITRDILIHKDSENAETYTVDRILDVAGQKGTGKWTVTAALDMGMPVTMISEAVFARCLSAMKEERVKSSKILSGPHPKPFTGDRKKLLDSIHDAILASKIVSYTQGYLLMRAAASEYHWNLNYGGIALMWRGGCIIRSKFLGKIKDAFDKNPNLDNLLLDSYFQETIARCQNGWREIISFSISNGIPLPAITSSLSYYDGLRTERLPANLLQAQRDYFGAHTYEQIGEPRNRFFHTNWTGYGGTTSSSSYSV